MSTPHFDSVIACSDKIYDSGYKEKALQTLISAFRASKDLSVSDRMNYFSWCSETFRKDHNDYNKYIDYADSMIALLEEEQLIKKLPNRYIQALNMKADAYFAIGLYNKSYENYFAAKNLASENQDSCSLSQFSYSLGMALYRQQRFTDAAAYFKEAYREIDKCKDLFIFFYRRQELLDNIGLCCYHDRSYDSAMRYYQKTIVYIDSNYLRFDKNESVYKSAKAVVLGNIADLYIVLKKYDSATNLLRQSTSINLQKGYTNSDALLAQLKLGNIYVVNHDLAHLKPLLADINAELDTIGSNGVLLSWYRLNWQYYDLNNDRESAYPCMKNYIELFDSLEEASKSLLAIDVDGKIKSLEKQKQIAILNRKSLKDKVYLIISLMLGLMAGIIIILILKMMQRTKENVQHLTALNNQIEEQKAKLQMALAELELKDKDKSRVLRSAAHDVLNPLGAISGLTAILIDESESYSDEHKGILHMIKEASDNSIGLSKEILEAADASEKTVLEKENTDINKLILSAIELFSVRASDKNIRLLFDPKRTPLTARVNRDKIWRVVSNLISNAIKFSYSGSAVEIRLDRQDDKFDISIQDTGVGIPEKNKPFVFNMFSEAKAPGTSGETPHGLGLSISLQIAKAHGGTIWFESESGKGTTFHLVIPMPPLGDEAIRQPKI